MDLRNFGLVRRLLLPLSFHRSLICGVGLQVAIEILLYLITKRDQTLPRKTFEEGHTKIRFEFFTKGSIACLLTFCSCASSECLSFLGLDGLLTFGELRVYSCFLRVRLLHLPSFVLPAFD